ncbi:MAG: ribonuclease H-like domain-containing protein [Eubacterium sp.]
MKIIKGPAHITFEYPLASRFPLDKILFFDIETTGLASKYCCIYLIGCMYFKNGEPYCIQWFAEGPGDEKYVLEEFINLASKYNTLIHFNGNSFDIPFVTQRCKKFETDFDFSNFNSVDLYKYIKPYRTILKLDNLKQKTIENAFGILRNDVFFGGDLIEVYKEYLSTKDERLFNVLLLHNYEDILNMGKLTSILSFYDFINGDFNGLNAKINTYKDINGNLCEEVIFSIKPANILPCSISFRFEDFYLSANSETAFLSVKSKNRKIRLYYPNYEEYYFLPDEDMAVHKCVAAFVDKNHREKATPLNCYSYIEINENMINDTEFIKTYVSNIFKILKYIK